MTTSKQNTMTREALQLVAEQNGTTLAATIKELSLLDRSGRRLPKKATKKKATKKKATKKKATKKKATKKKA